MSRTIAVALILCALSTCGMHPAMAQLPNGVTCDDVKREYANWSYLGKPIIRAWLREYRGYSRSQINEAEQCLAR